MEDVSKLAWEEQGWTAAQVDEAIDKLSLEEQVGVTKLRLYDNKLSGQSELPLIIHRYSCLNSFSFSAVFPAAILKLVNLEELHLNRNQLSSLPASIGQLAHLKELYVSKNQLSSLPKNMQNLTELIL